MLNTPVYASAIPPKDAQSPYGDYSKAVERDFRRDKRYLVTIVTLTACLAVSAGFNLFSSVVATQTNLELTKVAMMQPVRYVERGPDGIDRVIAVRNTMDTDKGREMETLSWFVTWSRWISGETAVNEANHAAARAKLAGADAVATWDRLRAADVKAKDGYRRDVSGVVVAEQDVPNMPEGARLYTLQWQEKTLQSGKIVKDETLMQNITIMSGQPREGALDGVNITLLTEPTVSFKQRETSRR